MSKSIFIVYGHDHESIDRLIELLRLEGVTGVTLKEKPRSTLTIVEQLEDLISSCSFGIALLTPDDRGRSVKERRTRFRTRQNVVFELGWIMAKYGRPNVSVLCRGEVEFPSDLLGILTIRYEKSIDEIWGQLLAALRDRGVINR